MRNQCHRAEGVGRSGVTGWPWEGRAENRRSTAVKVSDHLVERHIPLCSRSRRKVRSPLCVISWKKKKTGRAGRSALRSVLVHRQTLVIVMKGPSLAVREDVDASKPFKVV